MRKFLLDVDNFEHTYISMFILCTMYVKIMLRLYALPHLSFFLHIYLIFCHIFQDLQADVDRHQTNYELVQQSGGKVVRAMGVAGGTNSAKLQTRLEEMNKRWLHLMEKSMEIR